MRESVRCIMCIILLYLDRRQSQSSRRGIELINMDKSTAAQRKFKIYLGWCATAPTLCVSPFEWRANYLSANIRFVRNNEKEERLKCIKCERAEIYCPGLFFIIKKKSQKLCQEHWVRIHIKICLRAAQNNDGKKNPAKLHLRWKRKIYGARRAKTQRAKLKWYTGSVRARIKFLSLNSFGSALFLTNLSLARLSGKTNNQMVTMFNWPPVFCVWRAHTAAERERGTKRIYSVPQIHIKQPLALLYCCQQPLSLCALSLLLDMCANNAERCLLSLRLILFKLHNWQGVFLACKSLCQYCLCCMPHSNSVCFIFFFVLIVSKMQICVVILF